MLVSSNLFVEMETCTSYKRMYKLLVLADHLPKNQELFQTSNEELHKNFFWHFAQLLSSIILAQIFAHFLNVFTLCADNSTSKAFRYLRYIRYFSLIVLKLFTGEKFSKILEKQLWRAVYCYHITYAFHRESTLYSRLNVKELLARNRGNIWSLNDGNGIRTHNHLVSKQTLNHLAQLSKSSF